MKISSAVVFSLMLAGLSPMASASQALAQQKNCMACHAATARVVGPSFKEVAAKYAGQKDAPEGVAERIMKGSTGRWGFVPMPPNAQVSPDDAKALAKWILDQK